jgi:hypothetical protein
MHPIGCPIDRHAKDLSQIRAIDQEQLSLTLIATNHRRLGVALDALGAEHDHTFPESAGLALTAEEVAALLDNEVVALIRAERQQHLIAPFHELRKDRRLAPLTNVNRVAAGFRWCQQSGQGGLGR